MSFKDSVMLVLLAAIWGGSFLFMRYAVPELGVAPLIFLRVGLAALFLLPILLWQGKGAELKRVWVPSFVNGWTNSAIPFCLIAYSLLTLSSGFASILNAVTPIATAVVGFLWLRESMSWIKTLGMLIGIAGVTLLAWNKLYVSQDDTWQVALAIGAGILATLFYAISAIFTKRYLSGVDSMVLSTGSMLGATVVLLPLAILYWPENPISLLSWLAAIALAIICSALAYLMFFRLIHTVGPARATTVTFIVPVFGMLWGATLLNEEVSLTMLVASAITLFGTGLATGLLGSKQER
ncbi:EamA family transporter [Pseudoteredinibacter isoporae]|uniref:Drug/metabolite transporter (DMT)-like permease n=1 Tax=Pseudoteredinibacter isoporae TaxID=570281 RepID=A0A7X0JVG3_9GAMM|nr:drug/metabolite transporter (DMT)-like permease [Pseudoteredinibacter isoporae]NHO88017.1 DMT family transporter [Pseudoteredinibacter isoporae]NIB23652.1 DMT family transporter [Pseudoteredinibacter isoporae]